MKKFVFTLLFLIVFPLYASHIVGGEFELLHLTGNRYRLNLIYYFDVLHNDFKDQNGNPIPPEQEEPTLTVGIFQKSNNVLVTTLTLPFLSRTRVSYTQTACSNGEIVTDKLIYTIDFTMTPETYNDPQGYYVSWQRCCRNYGITNIYSQPIGSGIYAGQTFYLEFPPVVKNGRPFINSSPHLFPPLNDYACPGRFYYVNFAGVDDDGDSIVYSLTTPLNVEEATAIPPIAPGPYPLVQWRPGYDSIHIIDGSPDLQISSTGLLTCTPVKSGLFVFAVRANEFRNGVKIGETRRDFQMLVVTGCQPDQPPQIVGRKLTEASFAYVNAMAVSFSDTVSNADRCIVVRVSDPDSQSAIQNFSENVSIRVIPLNFKSNDVNEILPSVTAAHLVNGSTSDFMICFPQCPFLSTPFQIGIIAMDDACSLPMTDTLVVTVDEQLRPNTFPYFLPLKNIIDTVVEGSSHSWPLNAKDNEGDTLIISVLPQDFVLKDAGMNFNYATPSPGLMNGTFYWNAFCKNYEFSKKTDFTIKFLVDDKDPCNVVQYDTAVLQLKVILPKIQPKLKIYNETKSQDLTDGSVEMNLGHVAFDVVGTDIYNSPVDTLNLSLLSVDGIVGSSAYNFISASALHDVESVLTWDPNCSIFKDGSYDNDYTFKFLVENNHCKTPTTDTAYVKLRIKDIESTDKNFIPPNVITSNGDGCNDFFAIDIEDAPPCDGKSRATPLGIPPFAPDDNCTNRFEQVKIYDRWGKQVFESTDKKFRWYAQNESAGVYYYIIYYTKAQYKSSLTVMH